MALTAQQSADLRQWCGYSTIDLTAYSNVSYLGISLDARLASLSVQEEYTITTLYLVQLPLREAEIQTAAENLDTDRAAVWYRNKNEIFDRILLFNRLRLDLCAFLGFAPGPALQSGGRLVRA